MAYEIYEAETDSVELCSEAVDVEWLIKAKQAHFLVSTEITELRCNH